MVSASPRLQRLLLRLAHYHINIEFLHGKENVIADALSRVCPLHSSNPKIKESNIDVILVHCITQMTPVRALETVYWPGINKDIVKQYQSCKTCIRHSKTQRSEPLQSYPTPSLPWHTVATDLLELKNSKYLLIVDYYSRFPVLHKLTSTTSKVLIQELKAALTEMGVPTTIVSDGGPQYTSAEFKDFMKDWQIEHKFSSPRNPQSNGMAERCVQTMKAPLLKTIQEGEDVNLALLMCNEIYQHTTLNNNHRFKLYIQEQL